MASDTVEQIKNRIDIAEYIGAYTKLSPAGSNLKGLSPFTSEKTASFFVSPERQTFYCFSSGKGGDIFTFVQEMEGIDFKGALKILAEKTGVPLVWEKTGERSKRDVLFELLDKATYFFEEVYGRLKHPQEYSAERGITEETREKFRIGYAPHEWRTLSTWLMKHKYSKEDILRSGLAKENNGHLYDRFRGRYMFPICDTTGRVIAFSGRILPQFESEKEGSAKYVNSPETDLYHKSQVLYGIHMAKQAMRQHNRAIVVEGQMDLVLSHQAGVAETIALSGTALTTVQIQQILSHTNTIIFALDADGAGERALRRSAIEALALGAEVYVIPLLQGKDPADIILKEGSEAWSTYLEKKLHIVDFYIQKGEQEGKEKGSDTRSLLRYASMHIIPLIAYMKSRIDEEFYMRKLSQSLGVSYDAIRSEIIKEREKEIDIHTKQEIPHAPPVNKEVMASRTAILRTHILGILYWQKNKNPPDIDWNEALEKIKQRIPSEIFVLDEMKEKEKLLFEIESLYPNTTLIQEIIDGLANELEKELLRTKLEHITEELRRAEAQGEMTKSEELSKEHTTISQQLNAINN